MIFNAPWPSLNGFGDNVFTCKFNDEPTKRSLHRQRAIRAKTSGYARGQKKSFRPTFAATLCPQQHRQGLGKGIITNSTKISLQSALCWLCIHQPDRSASFPAAATGRLVSGACTNKQIAVGRRRARRRIIIATTRNNGFWTVDISPSVVRIL